MADLQKLVIELEENIRHQEKIEVHISKGSIGWHIEHCLLTINHIIAALEKSNHHDYKRSFDLRRNLVLFFGIIPRGKVKAPKRVQPQLILDEDILRQHILLTKKNLKLLNQLGSQHYFTHPFLGDFRLKPALRFMSIHTNHHLKIIREIVKSIA